METAKADDYRIVCFTDAGRSLMVKIIKALSGSKEEEDVLTTSITDLKKWTEDNFKKGNVLVFIGAMGIAVRSIAAFIEDKTKDPAVIVIDEKGEFIIPVLSGHIGGAVEASKKISEITGGIPVITTATDVEGLFSVDVFASKNNMYISDMKKAKDFSRDILKKKTATYYLDDTLGYSFDMKALSKEMIRVHSLEDKPDVIISPFKYEADCLQLVPKCIVIGIGCRKGTEGDALIGFVKSCLDEAGILLHAVRAVASVDIKAHEEGIIKLSDELCAEFVTYSPKTLMEQKGDFSSSEFVRSVTGADNICERSVIAYGAQKLIVKKVSQNKMTFAAGVMTDE